MDGDAIDRITRSVLDAIAGGEPIDPSAVMLLLERYIATGRADVRDALGPALAQAIDCGEERIAEWLMVLVEARAISDDDRVDGAARSLVERVRGGWPGRGRVRDAMQSIDACLKAANLDPDATLIAAAIDELERIVSIAYEPGEGLSATIERRSDQPGAFRDHVAAAAALVTAYQVTARLPYSMLAEELIQFARRSWWNKECGAFLSEPTPAQEADRFLENAEAARVLCRLAALHRDSEYRAVAVIAHASDYESDARRVLEWLASRWRDRGLDAASYGVALGEWLALAERDCP